MYIYRFSHCVQTISPTDHSSIYSKVTELPHEAGPGRGELPPGEGCYSCNVGDIPLNIPLSKRVKRSGKSVSKLVEGEQFSNWYRNKQEKDIFEKLFKIQGDVELTDVNKRGHGFKPSILKIVKRKAVRKKVKFICYLSSTFRISCNFLLVKVSYLSLAFEARHILFLCFPKLWPVVIGISPAPHPSSIRSKSVSARLLEKECMSSDVSFKGCRGVLRFPITFYKFKPKFRSLQKLNLKFKLYIT